MPLEKSDGEIRDLDSVSPRKFPYGLVLVKESDVRGEKRPPAAWEERDRAGYLHEPVTIGKSLTFYAGPKKRKGYVVQAGHTSTVVEIRECDGHIYVRTENSPEIKPYFYRLVPRSEHPADILEDRQSAAEGWIGAAIISTALGSLLVIITAIKMHVDSINERSEQTERETEEIKRETEATERRTEGILRGEMPEDGDAPVDSANPDGSGYLDENGYWRGSLNGNRNPDENKQD